MSDPNDKLDLPERLSLQSAIDTHVDQVLGLVNGNKSRAAKILRIERRTLYRMLARRKASAVP